MSNEENAAPLEHVPVRRVVSTKQALIRQMWAEFEASPYYEQEDGYAKWQAKRASDV